MVESWHVALALEAAAALVALVAGIGLVRLARWVGEPRLAWLAAFFLAWALQAAVHAGAALDFETREGLVAEEGFELQDAAFWLQHAVFLVALACGARALAHTRPSTATAMGPLLLAAEPLLRTLETLGVGLLLVLAVRNHLRKSTVSSLRTALGFLGLLAGQSWLLINGFAGPDPLGARDPVGEALLLVGMIVLATAVPRRRRAPG